MRQITPRVVGADGKPPILKVLVLDTVKRRQYQKKDVVLSPWYFRVLRLIGRVLFNGVCLLLTGATDAEDYSRRSGSSTRRTWKRP